MWGLPTAVCRVNRADKEIEFFIILNPYRSFMVKRYNYFSIKTNNKKLITLIVNYLTNKNA
jgi:hypothetical protein